MSNTLYSQLYAFNNATTGGYPVVNLININNVLYGILDSTSSSSNGIIFSYNFLTGIETTIFTFTDNNKPNSLLNIGGINGKFYGTSVNSGDGTIFSINVDGTGYTIIHSFSNTPDGSRPLINGLINETGTGTLYGITGNGGINSQGSIYSITNTDTVPVYTILYSFGSIVNDGINPNCITNIDNILYIVTENGGINGNGSICSYNLNTSTQTLLYSYTLPGTSPNSIINNNGILYITTGNLPGTISSFNPTDIIPISPLSLYTFNSPLSTVSANGLSCINGILYGTTYNGGTNNKGSIYSIDLSLNNKQVLYSFGLTGSGDGSASFTRLLNINGTLYGSSRLGGLPNDSGTIFSYFLYDPNPIPICYNKGTKILCLNDENNEEYILIENIRKGQLVKTYKEGYKKVELIGSNTFINDPTNYEKCMYLLPKTYSDLLIDDLIVTGKHSILVDSVLIESNELIKQMRIVQGNIQLIHDKQLLMAACSNAFIQLQDNNEYTYYHLTLENDTDTDTNTDTNTNINKKYGIWANGILSETTTITEFNNYFK